MTDSISFITAQRAGTRPLEVHSNPNHFVILLLFHTDCGWTCQYWYICKICSPQIKMSADVCQNNVWSNFFLLSISFPTSNTGKKILSQVTSSVNGNVTAFSWRKQYFPVFQSQITWHTFSYAQLVSQWKELLHVNW